MLPARPSPFLAYPALPGSGETNGSSLDLVEAGKHQQHAGSDASQPARRQEYCCKLSSPFIPSNDWSEFAIPGCAFWCLVWIGLPNSEPQPVQFSDDRHP